MSLAEHIYESTQHRSETPPVWIDFLFLFIITIIHIIYASKFTIFSFGYLKAKCDEKKSRHKWSEERLYLQTILSNRTDKYTNLNSNIAVIDEQDLTLIFSKLWVQLSLLRNLLKILLFVCCCIILILYLSFLLNILYEYFVVCIVNYQNGSFLALLILPFLWFVNASLIRFIIYGIMVSWSINVDNIADNIAYQQHHLSLKQYAHAHDDENPDEYDSEQSEEQIEPVNRSEGTIMREEEHTTFKKTIKGFCSDYFMAFHWRLLIIGLSAIATILALPSFANIETQPGTKQNWQLTDSFWMQLFLRYILLAMTSWLCLYFCLSIIAAIYGRIATLSVYNEILDAKTPKANDINKQQKKNAFLRLFCLIDVFGIKDKHINWINYKIIIYSLFVFSGILCIIIGAAIQNGLIQFVGIINLLYYGVQLLLNCKVRGIHYLWRADMVSLELKNWWYDHSDDTEDNDNKKKRGHQYQPSDSHAAQMSVLTGGQLHKMLSHYMSADSDSDEEDIIDENEEEKIHVIDHETPDESEKKIFTLYISMHKKIFTERRNLYAEKQSLNLCSDFCEIQKINFKIFCNYFYTIFRLYRTYWLLILPYHVEIRPLSVGSSGKSISERLVNYTYHSRSCVEMCRQLIIFIWHAIRGLIICGLFFLILIALLYVSIGINEVTVSYTTVSEIINNNTLNDSLSRHGLFATSENYGLCKTKWDGNLSIFDLASLAHVAYEIEEDEEDQPMSMQQFVCLYFDRIKPTDNTNKTCSWQIMNISRAKPAFFHMRHEKNKTDVIAIRGTWTLDEMSQDIALFNEIALLQAASWIIPITTLLPQSFIIQIVYFASLFEGKINEKVRARFDEPLFEYSYNYLLNTKNEIKSFYYIGHSLGGGIAQIVAAQLYHANEQKQIINNNNQQLLKNLEIKSFSLAAPGLVWNSRKFSFDVDDLYESATLIKPRHDIVSKIDQSGGLIQSINCGKSTVLDCHLTKNIISQLSDSCNVYDSHNPNLIQAFCQNKNGEFYMRYANYSS